MAVHLLSGKFEYSSHYLLCREHALSNKKKKPLCHQSFLHPHDSVYTIEALNEMFKGSLLDQADLIEIILKEKCGDGTTKRNFCALVFLLHERIQQTVK